MNICTLSCRISFFALVTPASGLPWSSSTMNFTSMPPSLLLCSDEIKLEAVHHVLADLGKDAGHRRDVADAQFFGVGRGGQPETEGQATAQQ